MQMDIYNISTVASILWDIYPTKFCGTSTQQNDVMTPTLYLKIEPHEFVLNTLYNKP